MTNRINTLPRAVKVYAAPSVYPVSLLELKAYLREINSDDDSLLMDSIRQATAELETGTRRAFINTTFDEVYDDWPLSSVTSACVRMNPLVSVTSITYVDDNGTTQTWAATNYTVDITSEPGRISLAWDKTIPTIRDVNNAVTIRYIAGYGATAATVPALAKQYIYLRAAADFCRRPLTDDEWRSLKSVETVLSYGL